MIPPGDHVLPTSKPLIGLRATQLITAIIILGLAAYGVTNYSFDGNSLILFTALATIIITVYIIVAGLVFPVAYNYWAVLALDIFAILFWLISFPLLASRVAREGKNGSVSGADGSTDCFWGPCFVLLKRGTDFYTFRNSMAAASSLGALEFILFVITLRFTSLHLLRNPKSRGQYRPDMSNTNRVGYGP